jgi:lipooligosaccharide transport system permease protein
VYPRAIRWFPVWQRNLRVWRRILGASILGNFGEPLLYLLALGYGLGSFVGEVQGMPYISFLASGIVVSSAMFTASFESMYSAYTRMEPQRTWDAMLTTPIEIEDLVVGEAVWAATKSLISGFCILIVGLALGAIESWQSLLALPVVMLTGLCFASMGLMVTSMAKSYDFFLYYTTLVVTPMLMLGGVFFPLERMPEFIQALSVVLPLTHAVALVRPLVTGLPLDSVLSHLAVIAGYTLFAATLAIHLIRKRMTS